MGRLGSDGALDSFEAAEDQIEPERERALILRAAVKGSIAANAAAHGNTCPAVPDIKDPITIGGQPGTLLGYNCGILINNGLTVHKGVAYLFGFRDVTVHAATDPADRAVFLAVLKSVHIPD